jgi:hypothetical protein
MKTLELKHLSAYLPYGLKIGHKSGAKSIHILHHGNGIGSISHILTSDLYKPILRPLSDLTKEIEVNREKFVPIEMLDNYHNFSIIRWNDIETDPTRYPFTIVQKLIEWHFDIFGLIEAGLAIDINTLKS